MRNRMPKGLKIFAGAAAIGGLSWLAWKSVERVRDSRILRLEESVQVGKPVEEVFNAWANLSRLPNLVGFLQDVQDFGTRSHWVAYIDGRRIEWDAELIQRLPNQALGWKSVEGPKHTGRINFSPLGEDTVVHVVMNYAPPLRLAALFRPVSPLLQRHLAQALRDFKAALEGKGQERIPATGTYGTPRTQVGRFGGPTSPVEFNRPTDASTFPQSGVERLENKGKKE
jgi:uncharacterized membrane protein